MVLEFICRLKPQGGRHFQNKGPRTTQHNILGMSPTPQALPIIKHKGKVVMELNLDHKLECKSFLPVISAASLNCHYNLT